MGKEMLAESEIVIPQGVKVFYKSRKFTVVGPRGTLSKKFSHLSFNVLKHLKNRKKQDVMKVQMWFQGRKQKCSCVTIKSQVQNMIRGVTKGYKFRMRFAYNHFPIQANVTNNGKVVEIKNFLGQRYVRKIEMLEGVIAHREEEAKDELTFTSTNLDNISLTCALIHQSVLVKEKDIRQFLDGIYVSDARMELADDEK